MRGGPHGSGVGGHQWTLGMQVEVSTSSLLKDEGEDSRPCFQRPQQLFLSPNTRALLLMTGSRVQLQTRDDLTYDKFPGGCSRHLALDLRTPELRASMPHLKSWRRVEKTVSCKLRAMGRELEEWSMAWTIMEHGAGPSLHRRLHLSQSSALHFCIVNLRFWAFSSSNVGIQPPDAHTQTQPCSKLGPVPLVVAWKLESRDQPLATFTCFFI